MFKSKMVKKLLDWDQKASPLILRASITSLSNKVTLPAW